MIELTGSLPSCRITLSHQSCSVQVKETKTNFFSFPQLVKSKSLTPYSSVFLFLRHMIKLLCLLQAQHCSGENWTLNCWSWSWSFHAIVNEANLKRAQLTESTVKSKKRCKWGTEKLVFMQMTHAELNLKDKSLFWVCLYFLSWFSSLSFKLRCSWIPFRPVLPLPLLPS